MKNDEKIARFLDSFQDYGILMDHGELRIISNCDIARALCEKFVVSDCQQIEIRKKRYSNVGRN